MRGKLLNPLADPVFKRIFGEEKEILTELINAFIELDEPVVDIEYLPQEILHDAPDGKLSVVDVRCIDSKMRTFIFEIQIVRRHFFEERVLYYAAKAYSRQLVKSRKYDELQPVYLMSILDHTLDINSPHWLHRYSFMDESNPQRKVKGIHLIYLELEKCRKRSIFNMNSIQEKWITFLTEPEKLMTMSTKEKHDYPFLIKAVELLDESKYTIGQLIAYDKYIDGVMSWNTNMAHSFDNGFDEGMEKGIEKGLQKGIEKGMEKGMEKGIEEGTNKIIEIIQELKNGNKSLDQIAIDYNISIEKVLELKNLIGG